MKVKVGLYVLHYIHSTHDYGISFTSDDTAPMHSYVHYPPSSDTEAYEDATPPKLGSSNQLSAYSDACWGSQLGSSVADGTLLPLFKFRSMNGGIVFKNAGPLVWLGDRQERTIDVEHVAGTINPADIFTKEMGDGAQFHRLRDSFMS
jgi:hypothetical protein